MHFQIAFSVLGIIASVYLIGLLLHNPRRVVMIVEMDVDLDRLWSQITNIEDQINWRSDLKDVDVVLSDREYKTFIEFPKFGPSITFKETVKQLNQKYRIEIVPTSGFSGYSTIDLEKINGKAQVTFVECSFVDDPLRRVLSYLLYRPKRRMNVYINDLMTVLKGEYENRGNKPCSVDYKESHINLWQRRPDSNVEHDRYSVGLNHLAFHVSTRSELKDLFAWAKESNCEILDEPADYPDYGHCYHAFYLKELNGIKIEIATQETVEPYPAPRSW